MDVAAVSSPVPRVVLKPKRAQPFYARHPWVFAGAIERIDGTPEDGAEVDLVSTAGNFIARGLFNSQSKIQVRLYSWEEGRPLDHAFWKERIDRAVTLRHHVLHVDRSAAAAYRVVFSESDFLSGMVVDRYADFLTVQFTSLGMGQRRAMFAELLNEALSPRGIYLRTERGIGRLEGVELHDEPLLGDRPPEELIIEERGLRFAVNLAEGQKTGYYLDQRDNRATVARLCPGKRVLDAFCYSGGFGMHAAKAGAESVECVDASEAAIQLARRNAVLNAAGQVTFVAADVFKHLAQRVAEKAQYDVIVLDPPKFARDRRAVPDAIQGYRRLHALALKLLAPDGVLVSCCCSGLIEPGEFEDAIVQMAADARRDLQILERRGPSPDHPVAASCRETSYLKCLISRVI